MLAELTPERQLEVAERIATSEPPQRDVLRHLARSLGARLNNFTGSDGAGLEVGGLGTLAKIMKGVGREVEQNILAGFSETRPDLAEELKKNMFVFDDLVVLDDRSIQRLQGGRRQSPGPVSQTSLDGTGGPHQAQHVRTWSQYLARGP